MLRIIALSVALFAVGCAKQAVRPDEPAAPQPAAPQAADATQTKDEDVEETAPKSFAERPEPGTKALCPVSEEVFTVDEDTKVVEYEGRWYAFCCEDCISAFEADPAEYAAQ